MLHKLEPSEEQEPNSLKVLGHFGIGAIVCGPLKFKAYHKVVRLWSYSIAACPKLRTPDQCPIKTYYTGGAAQAGAGKQ